jgi:hypothetical protein
VQAEDASGRKQRQSLPEITVETTQPKIRSKVTW